MPNSYGFIKTVEDKQKNFLYNSNCMKLSRNMGYFLPKIHAQRLPITSTYGKKVLLKNLFGPKNILKKNFYRDVVLARRLLPAKKSTKFDRSLLLF